MSAPASRTVSSDLLRAIIDSAPIRVFWKDRDCRYLGCNELFAHDAGLETPDDIVGLSDDDLAWKEFAEDFRRDDRAVMESGDRRLQYEETVVRHDGRRMTTRTSKVPLRDGEGRIVGVLGVYIDETERATAERQLQISEDRFRGLVEQAPFPVQIFGRDGRSQTVNRAWEKLWGVTSEALEGYNLFEDGQAIERGIVAEVRRAFAGEQVVMPPSPYDRSQTPQIRSIGGVLWLRTVIYPLRDEDGEIREVVVLHQDVTDRVRHETAAAEHDREFRTLFETSPDPIWLLDENNRFVLANRAAALALGYDTPEQLVSLHPSQISPEQQIDGSNSADKSAKMIEIARRVGTHRFEWMHRHRDGSTIPFEITLAKVELGREPRIYCVGRDIRARKDAELKLRRNRDFLEQIITNASEGICVYADLDVHPYLLFSVWNDRMHEITGYTMDEMNRTGFFPALFGDGPVVQAALERRKGLLRGEEMHDETWKIRTKSGDIRTVEMSTTPVAGEEGRRAIIGMMRDRTAQVAADEALQRSEQKYRGIFDESVAAILVLEPGGRVRDANQAAIEMMGYSREELLQLSAQELDSDWAASRHGARTILGGKRLVNFEHGLRCKDGRIITVLNNSSPVLAPDGKVTALQATLFDITEWRRAQQEQERLKEQLASTQRLESVGRLAGGVAHDFNNMLSVILGRTSLAMELLPPGDPLLRHLKEVMDAGQRSADLTRQLLAFARRQMTTPLDVDLNDKITGLVRMLTRLIGEDITLTFTPGVDLAPVRIDPSQVDQVLTNLCLNARDAIDGPGHVAITTANDVLHDDDSNAPREMVRITVEDDGCGMTPDVVANIFEPFFTTKEMGKGSGLGLATVYGIVKQNDGQIDVTSHPGAGTTFRVWLPAAAPRAQAGSTTGTGAPAETVSGSILLVEDEPAVREMTQLMLESRGYHVMTAPNGPAAIALLTEARFGRIDLLVTDVIMPEMSGAELARRLRERIPGLAVLFVSGYPADAIEGSGVDDGSAAFLQKPFTGAALAAKVAAAMRGGVAG